MSAQLQGVSDAEISALAAHFSAQPLRPAPAPADAAQLASGKELAAKLRCASCHLDDFAGREQMPRLAGQREDYLADSLLAYRDGRRVSPDGSMNEVLHGTSDADLRALAHYLAHQEVAAAAPAPK
jgi:cytochrome c553